MRPVAVFGGAALVTGAYTKGRVAEQLQVDAPRVDTPMGDIGPDQPRTADADRSLLVAGMLAAGMGAAFLVGGLYGRVQASRVAPTVEAAAREAIERIADPSLRGPARVHDARQQAAFVADLHGDYQPFLKIGAGLSGVGVGLTGGTLLGQRSR